MIAFCRLLVVPVAQNVRCGLLILVTDFNKLTILFDPDLLREGIVDAVSVRCKAICYSLT